MAHVFRQKSQALQQTGTSIGLDHTPGAAATVAILSIVTESLTARSGGAPTIDGVTATQIGARQVSGECGFELWYALKAFSGSLFSTTTPNDGALACNVSVVTADAGSGFASAYHAFDEDQGAAGTEDSTVLTVAPSAVGDFLYARIGSDENVNTSVTAAAGTNWDGGLVQLYSDDIGNQSSMSHYSIADSTAGANTITYSFSNAGYAASAVVFKSEGSSTAHPYSGEGAKSLAAAAVPALGFGGTFDDVRQLIIDGIISAQSEGTGFNARRSTVQVGDVTRTSDTVATVVFTNLSGLDITLPETVTANINWRAVAGKVAIVATPTFGIGVSHVYSGMGTQSSFASATTTFASDAPESHLYSGDGAYVFDSATVRAKGKEPTVGGARAYSSEAVISSESTAAYSYSGEGVFALASDTVRAKGKTPQVAGERSLSAESAYALAHTAAYAYSGQGAYSKACATLDYPNTFANLRRAIINGIVAAQNEAGGINIKRGTIPLTAVVRTDDNTVTVSFASLTGFDITAQEVWTYYVPWKAVALLTGITATPTVTISLEGAHVYSGSGTRKLTASTSVSKSVALHHDYSGQGERSLTCGTVASVAQWGDWSDSGTFTTEGIATGGSVIFGSSSVYYKTRGTAHVYSGMGAKALANAMERSVGRVYHGTCTISLGAATIIVPIQAAFDSSAVYSLNSGSVYSANLHEDNAYSGLGAFSFQAAYQRVLGKTYNGAGAYFWDSGTLPETTHATGPRPDLENKPAVRTASREALPTRPGSSDGALTDPDQDGAWDEYPVDGAYTSIGYEKERKPFHRYTMTKEGRPT